jgi:hypothetical protein
MYRPRCQAPLLLQERDPDRREGKAKFLIRGITRNASARYIKRSLNSFPGCRVASRGGEAAAGHNAAQMRALPPPRREGGPRNSR